MVISTFSATRVVDFATTESEANRTATYAIWYLKGEH